MMWPSMPSYCPPDRRIPVSADQSSANDRRRARTWVVVFTVVLLLVVFITNTPLRGLWSGIAVLLIAVMTVTFAWMGVWPQILAFFGRISIHMNMGFYVCFSSLL